MAEHTNPLVSIVFTSYNHKEYLEKALESLLNQTFKNFELIIVDDASTDGSQEVLMTYEANEKVNLNLKKENSGSYVLASNYGASMAKGKYILFAQCDDYSEPTQLEELTNAALENENCGVVYSISNLVDSQDRLISDDYIIRESFFKETIKNSRVIEGRLMRRFLSYSCIIPNLSAALIQRDLYNKVSGLSSDFKVVADWDFWLKLSQLTDFYYIKKPLNNFRQHQTTIRSSIKIETQIVEVYRMFYFHIANFHMFGQEKREFQVGAGAIWFAYSIENLKPWLKSSLPVSRKIRTFEKQWFRFFLAGTKIQFREYFKRKLGKI